MMEADCAGKTLSTKKGLVADVITRLQLPGMRGQLQAQFAAALDELGLNGTFPAKVSNSRQPTGVILFVAGANVE